MDNREKCPRCGAWANIQNGTYEFVGRVMTAVRAPGVTRESILALQALASGVQAGTVSDDDAQTIANEIGSAIGKLWAWLGTNNNNIIALLTILTFLVTLYAAESADRSSDQQHIDAGSQIQATQIQTQAIRTGTQAFESEQQVQEKIYELLVRQGVRVSVPEQLPPMTGSNQARKPRPGKFLNSRP